MASSHIFKGDIFGLIQQKELKADSNGRSNILLLGTSEDDPGHEGSYLTDSIMILSISQSKKDAYMISIPRDLYVKYRRSCNSGNAGKINEYFNCVNSDWSSTEAEDERQAASRKFFGNIVGLDLQYSVHVNYTVLRDLVSALGGIKVTIESRDPRGQMVVTLTGSAGVETLARAMPRWLRIARRMATLSTTPMGQLISMLSMRFI